MKCNFTGVRGATRYTFLQFFSNFPQTSLKLSSNFSQTFLKFLSNFPQISLYSLQIFLIWLLNLSRSYFEKRKSGNLSRLTRKIGKTRKDTSFPIVKIFVHVNECRGGKIRATISTPAPCCRSRAHVSEKSTALILRKYPTPSPFFPPGPSPLRLRVSIEGPQAFKNGTRIMNSRSDELFSLFNVPVGGA